MRGIGRTAAVAENKHPPIILERNAQLFNEGYITADAPLSIAEDNAAQVNAGIIQVSSGDLTITQSGASPSFTNYGIIDVNAGHVLTITGSSLANSGTIKGSGTIAANIDDSSAINPDLAGAGLLYSEPFNYAQNVRNCKPKLSGIKRMAGSPNANALLNAEPAPRNCPALWHGHFSIARLFIASKIVVIVAQLVRFFSFSESAKSLFYLPGDARTRRKIWR